jgi:hypothetical protein
VSLKKLSTTYPGIAYASANRITFSYSSTVSGSVIANWTAVNPDSTTYSFLNGVSLAINNNNNPCIAWIAKDPTNFYLKYSYSNQQNGSSGWNTLTLLTSTSIYGVSLNIVNGYPAIAINNNGNLLYYTSTSIDGSSGWTFIQIYTFSNILYSLTSVTLNVVNNNPVIGYISDSGSLIYLSSFISSGNNPTWALSDIGAATKNVYYPINILQLYNSVPAIVYNSGNSVVFNYGYSVQFDWTAI